MKTVAKPDLACCLPCHRSTTLPRASPRTLTAETHRVHSSGEVQVSEPLCPAPVAGGRSLMGLLKGAELQLCGNNLTNPSSQKNIVPCGSGYNPPRGVG